MKSHLVWAAISSCTVIITLQHWIKSYSDIAVHSNLKVFVNEMPARSQTKSEVYPAASWIDLKSDPLPEKWVVALGSLESQTRVSRFVQRSINYRENSSIYLHVKSSLVWSGLDLLVVVATVNTVFVRDDTHELHPGIILGPMAHRATFIKT